LPGQQLEATISTLDLQILDRARGPGRPQLRKRQFYLEAKRDAAEQMQVLARRLIEAQDLERRQLARELHDRAGQNLTALSVNLNILKTLVAADLRAELHSRLDDSTTLVAATTEPIET